MLPAVTSTVNVTASDPPPIEESAQKNTIGQSTVENAPNQNEKIDSLLPLVPGVVRGPDGRINMKGAQATQAGWLVNSANVTDPATGGQAINLPIDVVSSVQVISNPYDPEYGKFTGAVSSVETRTSNLDKFHFSVQNLAPRARDRDGHIVGIEAFTPRTTLTGPLIKDRLAFTQSFEYRFVRTPVESLPPLQRDTKLESFDSFSQLDLKINDKPDGDAVRCRFPRKVRLPRTEYFHPSALDSRPAPARISDFGATSLRRGVGRAAHVATGLSRASMRTSIAQQRRSLSSAGRNDRRRILQPPTSRYAIEWNGRRSTRRAQSTSSATHQLKAGFDFSHSSYDGRQQFSPVDIVGVEGSTAGANRVWSIPPLSLSTKTSLRGLWEINGGLGRAWRSIWGLRVRQRLGHRFDACRAACRLDARIDKRSQNSAEGWRRIVLRSRAFECPGLPPLPRSDDSDLRSGGRVIVSSTLYSNVIAGGIRNPRSEAWNVELDRQVTGAPAGSGCLPTTEHRL